VKFGVDVQEDQLRQGMAPGSEGWGLDPEEQWGRLTIGTSSEPVPTVPGQYERFYEQVADSLLDDAPMPVDIDDAVATLRVIEAARASAQQRMLISL
jgi:predicted dehydrogenase